MTQLLPRSGAASHRCRGRWPRGQLRGCGDRGEGGRGSTGTTHVRDGAGGSSSLARPAASGRVRPCRAHSPTGSAGGRPRPPIRSKAATSTTTGGPGSRTPDSGCVEPSGDACDQYHRYPADLDLLAALGFNSYRFSIEWSRIEPEEGQFSAAALDHYRRVCAACLERGLDATVTFHHFTTPRWATADGGWSNPAIVDRFGRFCEVAGGALGDLITRACTINEPNIVSFLGYYGGVFPPGSRDRDRWLAASDHFQAGHRRAVEVLKAGPGRLPGGPDAVHDRLPGRAPRRRGRGLAPGADAWPRRGRVPRELSGRRLLRRADLHPDPGGGRRQPGG